MRKSGSITVFLALLLTCVFSAVFALLEAARVSGLKANAQLSTMQAKDTVLASYERSVWENYHLLFWENPKEDFPELELLEYIQQDAIAGNRRETSFLKKNYYMLQVNLAEVETTAYQLATDSGGAAFQEQAAEMMKDSVSEDALRSVISWMNGCSEEDSSRDLENEALDALEELQAASVSETDPENSYDTAQYGDTGNLPDQISENPLEWIKKVKEYGIYALMIPQEEISEKAIDLNSCIGKRSLQTGNMTVSADRMDRNKMLFRLYLSKYFYDAAEDAKDHALDYELEYMIIGKNSDEANLKGVIRRLLLMREAANLAYLEGNAQRRQEAVVIASALTAAVGHPELEIVVRQGILAVWAYAESISDVRILLEGGKVSLVKTDEQWHTEISRLSSTVASAKGGQQQTGLSYSHYLQLLMWTMPDQKLSERAMDMIEKNTGIQMDCMVCRAECKYMYEASPLFWSYVSLGRNSAGIYRFTDEEELSFLFD